MGHDITLVINSGDYEVLFSGTVIQYEDNSISFHFDSKTYGKLSIIISFESDHTNVPKIKADKIDNRTLLIKLVNFNNSVGTGNVEPGEIGTYGGRKLLISYRVYRLAEAGRTLHYTFYLGETV